MEPRIVIALGGNALGKTPEEQKARIDQVSGALVGLIEKGYEIIVTHGNGPQVGMIQSAFTSGAASDTKVPQMPLAECTAMSEGYIGYHLQAGLLRELRRRGMPWEVATLVTQVEVDPNDDAFQNPTKPIGAFYTKEEADELKAKEPDAVFAPDAGRGYRRMVASPKPRHIVEIRSIKNLLDNEFVVIACGGGGVPVVRHGDGDFVGVDAVIDKDLAAERLAEEINADHLFILTAVDRVALNYGTPQEKQLSTMTVEDATRYCKEGHFAPGSMLPKVQAAIAFAQSAPGRKAVICSLEKAPQALDGSSGTVITGNASKTAMASSTLQYAGQS
ncbi:MAG: carbamate kinase [Clostridia bacterium]|nr:carbamate kinase [Clostridia bacterium]